MSHHSLAFFSAKRGLITTNARIIRAMWIYLELPTNTGVKGNTSRIYRISNDARSSEYRRG
jgi:hypothetical protein